MAHHFFCHRQGSWKSALSPELDTPKSMHPRCIERRKSLDESTVAAKPQSPMGVSISGFGALQPDLYIKKAPLVISLKEPSVGRLNLRLSYNSEKIEVHVHIIRAQDLTGYEEEGFNDPYVKITLIPGVDSKVRQTRVHRNELNPFFDEHFTFPISDDELSDKTLLLQVYDNDRLSRSEVVGVAKVPLSKVEVYAGAEIWAELSRESRRPEELQQILISLYYLPNAGRLTVAVLKQRNMLLPKEGKDTNKVFVKVYLLINGKRFKKKKMDLKLNNNSAWNEGLFFSLPSANLHEASIEVCVVAGGTVAGWCCLGAEEPASEGRHWALLAQETHKRVAMWHTLR